VFIDSGIRFVCPAIFLLRRAYVCDVSMSAPPRLEGQLAASIHQVFDEMGHQIEGQMDEHGNGSVAFHYQARLFPSHFSESSL
jgi:hypothetical protein